MSGGERNRVQLAKLLKEGGNMIILDEPSNDLDVEVLRSLEEGLLNFAGSALIVSHDRYMLDRLCTHSEFDVISVVSFYLRLTKRSFTYWFLFSFFI